MSFFAYPSSFGRRRRRSSPLAGWGGGYDSYFVGQDELVDQVKETEPDPTYVELREETYEEPDDEIAYRGRKMTWLRESNYIVLVPVEKVNFMEGNLWGLEHAAALYRLFREGPRMLVKPPDARLYRIDEAAVVQSEAWDDEGELEYQLGMERPWRERDAGTFYVQLIDGNHRALAAIAAGEDKIPVVVSSNYRKNVRDEEWI